MTMTPYRAISVIEGFADSGETATPIEAFQFLIDTGLAWKLQGSYGRQAAHLISLGVCHAAPEER